VKQTSIAFCSEINIRATAPIVEDCDMPEVCRWKKTRSGGFNQGEGQTRACLGSALLLIASKQRSRNERRLDLFLRHSENEEHVRKPS